MPKVFRGVDQHEFALPTREHERPQRIHRARQGDRHRHCQHEVERPIGMLERQNVVEENLIEDGRRQPRHDHAKVEHHHEHHRQLRRREFFGERFDDAVSMSLGLELIRRTDLDGDAGVRCAELLPRHAPTSHRGIVEISDAVLDPLEHHEMRELPMNDQRILLIEQLISLVSETLGGAISFARGSIDIARLHSVAIDTALLPQLLERNPLTVMSKNHRKACRAALNRFHLQNGRHLHASPARQ